MPENQSERRGSLRQKRSKEDDDATPPPSASSKKLRSSSAATPPSKASPPSGKTPKAASGAGGSGSARKKVSRPSKASNGNKAGLDETEEEPVEEDAEEQQLEDETPAVQSQSPQKRKGVPKSKRSANDQAAECFFLGDPVSSADAKKRWPDRYSKKNGGDRGPISSNSNGNEDDSVKATHHYLAASVDNCVYSLNDDVYVKAAEGEDDYIGRIVELFEGVDRQLYFTAQWFFRAKDTVIKEHASSHDKRRVFLSEEKNDNVLDCIISKVKIVSLSPYINLAEKEEIIPHCDLYYDMTYSLSYSTFANLPSGDSRTRSGSSSVISSDSPQKAMEVEPNSNAKTSSSSEKIQLSLLDMYSGCGAMSTGLCLGASMSSIDLVTRWAVDINSHACKSLKLNHPQAEVRNEGAENFLSLVKEWVKICQDFSLIGTENSAYQDDNTDSMEDDETPECAGGVPGDEFEVGKIVGICYGDPHNTGETGIKFKVRWKGYGPSEDTWEPKEGLSKCEERIENFVKEGYKRRILPLPGCVDVICGGPPCQGISGFNRFRKKDAPLEDPKNQQMVVFMDIVDFLKPKYVLMENVVDILKFAGGFLGRYALSRLVQMNYQARLGIMAAGSYGLPQFRMRCFLWGAQPSQKLPPFPLPTHDVVVRGGAPNEFEQNIVAYDEKHLPKLEKALLLGDAISDLPSVKNDENRDETTYGRAPKTEFQRFIRLGRTGERSTSKSKLFDHMPLQLNEDDYQRVCQIPKRKGANFRDLQGVKVGADNIVEWDPDVPRVLLPSGKPLVPDYAMSFIKGKSLKPFARLWWDQTVPTVVTRAEPHNQAILHPEQDRVLTIRENARLQGFPDYYRLCGPVKERYIQVGNAVAVPVSRALGYVLGSAYVGDVNCKPLLTLPAKFPCLHEEHVPSGDSDTTVE